MSSILATGAILASLAVGSTFDFQNPGSYRDGLYCKSVDQLKTIVYLVNDHMNLLDAVRGMNDEFKKAGKGQPCMVTNKRMFRAEMGQFLGNVALPNGMYGVYGVTLHGMLQDGEYTRFNDVWRVYTLGVPKFAEH